VRTSLQLSTVEVATEIEVPFPLFNGCTHFVGWHLAIVHLSIPNTECGAGRRSYNPFRIVVIYHLARQLPIFRFIEIPWTTIWLVCPEIEVSETCAIERSPGSIGFRYNRALTKHLHECRCAGTANNLVDN
jgi:hypothetical protein